MPKTKKKENLLQGATVPAVIDGKKPKEKVKRLLGVTFDFVDGDEVKWDEVKKTEFSRLITKLLFNFNHKR